MPTHHDEKWNPAQIEAALPLLWAKLSPAGYHPLRCHLLDVAAVAEALWQHAVPPVTRVDVATDLGLSDGDAQRWITLWAGLHDIGKASPCFARQNATTAALLAALGLPIDRDTVPADVPHGAISTFALQIALKDDLGLAANVAKRVATVVGGHHGTFPRPALRQDALRAGGGPLWEAIRRELILQVAAMLGIDTAERPGKPSDATAIWLAGFVSVADWIGSNQDVFPLLAVAGRDPTIDPTAYLSQARRQAGEALDLLGWRVPSSRRPSLGFGDLFPGLSPNPMQRVVIDLGERVTGPCLVVVEAETGSGKSEAAFWLADRWGAREGRTGVYLALPTRATSDQMFGRLRRFLERRYHDSTVDLQLLHGLAGLSSEFGELRRLADRRPSAGTGSANLLTPQGIDGPSGDDGTLASIVAAEWFTHRKRGLLAPFGVGTIDQALLSVLQTRHHFVRLAGLAGKTVVLDEVHAYDTYMSTLLEQLLRWLAALGTSVILLSATLPVARRDALIAAYREGLDPAKPSAGPRPSAPPPLDADRTTPYPRVSWASRDGAGAISIPQPATDHQRGVPRRVSIEWVDGDVPTERGAPFPLGDRLRDALTAGGCAAVVCNTVARAQAIYQALQAVFPGEAIFATGSGDGGPELDLLHARFRYRDREEREHRTLARFGKPDDEAAVPGGPARPVHRPQRAIVVATQVIEQSLDLDFDLLITDPAPIDLILQRMGRLHRHPGRDRPASLRQPRLWICRPAETDGVPRFDPGSEFVYEPHLLLRSWLTLRALPAIAVPNDVEALVEAVYDDTLACPPDASPALRTRWNETRADLDTQRARDRSKAAPLLVLRPGHDDAIFDDKNRQLAEDDPSFHPDLQAMTRLAHPSVDVVCLTPEERADLLPSGRPTLPQALQLLRHAVSIGSRLVYHDLQALPVPTGWKRSPLLRHHRLLLLDEAGGCRVGNHRIVRNEEVGIVIEPVAR